MEFDLNVLWECIPYGQFGQQELSSTTTCLFLGGHGALVLLSLGFKDAG